MEEREDEIAVCDVCGQVFPFDDGVIRYINGEPLLLCPHCEKLHDLAKTAEI